jgi:ABC-type glycerol-3-phosphate transport system permease component
MIPFQVLMVPLFIMVNRFGWIDIYKGLIIPACASAFGIFFMRQSRLSIPEDLLDAARIDGCGELRIFFNIVVPNMKPALAVLIIFIFMGNWNSFLWPLIVTRSEELYTLPVGLAMYEGRYSTDYNVLMAASVVVLLPIMIVFMSLQRHFIKGVVLTGIKG